MAEENVIDTLDIIRDENESVIRSFRQVANDNNSNIREVAKDLFNSVRSVNSTGNMNASIQGLSDEMEISTRRIEDTNQILMNSVNIQNQILQQLGLLSDNIILMGQHITSELKNSHGTGGEGGIVGALELGGEVAVVGSVLTALSEVITPITLVGSALLGLYEFINYFNSDANKIKEQLKQNGVPTYHWNWSTMSLAPDPTDNNQNVPEHQESTPKPQSSSGVIQSMNPSGTGGNDSKRSSTTQQESSGTPQEGSLTKTIFGGESGGNYDIYNAPDGHGGYKAGQMKFEDMTVGEVMEKQKNGEINATGAYQIIPGTLRAGVKALGIDPSQKFDKATQDKLYGWLAGDKRPALRDYITGKSDDLDAAHKALSHEWTSVAYKGQSLGGRWDKASISDDKAEKSIIKSREAFKSNGGNYVDALNGIDKPNPKPEDTKPDSKPYGDSPVNSNKALLAVGTNNWYQDPDVIKKHIEEAVKAVRDKGMEPILVLPNPNIHGKDNAYKAAMEAASEFKLHTEMPSSWDKKESYHISTEAGKQIREKYPDIPSSRVLGDSNAGQGRLNGDYSYARKPAEFIADKINNLDIKPAAIVSPPEAKPDPAPIASKDNTSSPSVTSSPPVQGSVNKDNIPANDQNAAPSKDFVDALNPWLWLNHVTN